MKLTLEILNSQKRQLGLAWRSILAQRLVASNCRLAGCEDAALRDYIAYLQKVAICGAEESAAASFPAIAAALAINSDSELTAQLKIMICGRLDTGEILTRSKQESLALTTWRSLFFDIADCFDATSWLADHLIAPERKAGRNQFAAKLGLALRGGPDAARLALTLDTGLPLAKAERLEREELQLALKKDRALSMEVTTPEDSFRWFKLHEDYKLAEQKLALDREKFAARCTELQRRHERQVQEAASKERARVEAAGGKTDQQEQLRQRLATRVTCSLLAQLTWGSGESRSSRVQPVPPVVIPLSSRPQKTRRQSPPKPAQSEFEAGGNSVAAQSRLLEAGPSDDVPQQPVRQSA